MAYFIINIESKEETLRLCLRVTNKKPQGDCDALRVTVMLSG